jgi:transcriptional regulator with XRE-family HTH domain
MNEVQGQLLALKENGWTMAAIADEPGVSNMTVSTWRNGTRNAENARSVLFKLDSMLERKRIPKDKRRGLRPPLANSPE